MLRINNAYGLKVFW